MNVTLLSIKPCLFCQITNSYCLFVRYVLCECNSAFYKTFFLLFVVVVVAVVLFCFVWGGGG